MVTRNKSLLISSDTCSCTDIINRVIAVVRSQPCGGIRLLFGYASALDEYISTCVPDTAAVRVVSSDIQKRCS